MTLESIVAALADKQAITEVIYRYCRAIDRCDGDLLRSCFHADSTRDHGPFEGPSADFCKFALQLLAQVGATQHLVGNVLIEVTGDTATSESYWTAYHRILADGPRENAGVLVSRGVDEDLFIGGRYIDRFERRQGEWRIASVSTTGSASRRRMSGISRPCRLRSAACAAAPTARIGRGSSPVG